MMHPHASQHQRGVTSSSAGPRLVGMCLLGASCSSCGVSHLALKSTHNGAQMYAAESGPDRLDRVISAAASMCSGGISGCV